MTAKYEQWDREWCDPLRREVAKLEAERDLLRAQLAAAQQHILNREDDEGAEIRTRASVPADAELDALVKRANRYIDKMANDELEWIEAVRVVTRQRDAIIALRRRVAELEAELTETHTDGSRLDWLEQYQPTADEDGEMLIALVGSWTFNRVRHNEGLRAAIDAAIAKEPQDA